MPRPQNPKMAAVLLWVHDHPDEKYPAVEERFGLGPGIVALWVSRARKAFARGESPISYPTLVKTPKPQRVKPSVEAHPPKLTLLQTSPEYKETPSVLSNAEAAVLTRAPLEAGMVDLYRKMIYKQLTYLTTEGVPSNGKEHKIASDILRGAVADFTLLAGIESDESDAKKEAQSKLDAALGLTAEEDA